MAPAHGKDRRWPPPALLGHVVSENGNYRDKIDWSAFKDYPENTVRCVCGHEYRSHSKFVMDVPAIIARFPCRVCGGERMQSSRSDVESWTT